MKFGFSIIKRINTIVILGRGTSSKNFFTNKTISKNIQDIMLINYEEDDLDDKEILVLGNHRIHILFNISEPHLSKEQISKLSISSTHIGRTKSMRFRKLGKRQSRRGDIYGKVKYLPNKINKYWYLNNCGLLGIAYATKVLRAQKIILYGFDFYQDLEFFEKPQNKKVIEDHSHTISPVDSGKNEKLMFIDFVKNNPSVDFLISSNTDFKPTSNLHLI